MSGKTQSTKRKAKRKLSDFDFTGENSHIALVGPEVGGPANERTTLVMKANKFTDEEIVKMQQIRVTMELPEFLQKFFHMYYEDSYILAKLLGYEQPEEQDEVDSYEDYIERKLESFEVIKSLHEAEDITSVLSGLDANAYIGLLKDQEQLEKAFKESSEAGNPAEEKSSTEVNAEVGADVEAEAIAKAENPAPKLVLYKRKSDGGWEPTETKAVLKKSAAGENKVNSEEKMTEKVNESTVAEFEVEVVEKSAVEAIEKAAKQEKETLEKALATQKEELQKALELVQKFEQEKKEAVTKARFQQVKDAVKDEAKAEVLFKAVNLLEDAAEFEAVVKSLKDMTDLAEKGEMFIEKGVSVEGEGTEVKQESAVAKILKSQNK
jgi:hypothetical protein